MRKLLVLPCLGLALLAGGCSAPSDAERAGRAEEAALRERLENMERLEREDAAERRRMAGEIAALRQELETMRREMDGPPQPPAKEGEEPKPAKKSPRQALKQGFNDMVAGARRTLDRLGRELDESLAKKKGDRPKAAPAPESAPAKPEGPTKPEAPAGSGTQI